MYMSYSLAGGAGAWAGVWFPKGDAGRRECPREDVKVYALT